MELSWNDVNINTRNKTSGSMKTTCPQCSHLRKKKSDPCLSVNLDKKMWNCHNCGWAGGLKVQERKQKTYTIPSFNNTPLSDKTLAYFTNTRKISKSTVIRFRITEEVKVFPQVQEKRKAICFNYFRGDKLINVKFRDANKNMFMVSGAELVFYGLDLLEDSHRYNNEKAITITEGEFEPLSFYESGIDGAVSVPNGASAGNNKLEYLDNCIDVFEGITKIILATDDDAPGIALRNELARRLGKERCFFVAYPPDCKDPNEVLTKYGKEKLKEMHDNPIPFPIEGMLSVGEIHGEIVDLYQNGIDKGIKVDLPEFDQLLNFKTNQLTTITGIPSHGKSVFAEFIMMRLMKQVGWKFAVFSPEHYPTALHLQRLAKMMVGKPFFYHKDYGRMSFTEMESAIDFLSDKLYFIQPGEDEITLDNILDTCKGLVLRHGVNALILDPWNEIDHDYGSLSETQYIEKALRKLKRFKSLYDIHVFLIAHPTKMQKQPSTNKYDVPTLYSISGSANFYNKTDNGICVYRDFETNTTNVYVQKVKFSHLGRVGDCAFMYNPQNERFFELGSNQDNNNWLLDESNYGFDNTIDYASNFENANTPPNEPEERDPEPDF